MKVIETIKVEKQNFVRVGSEVREKSPQPCLKLTFNLFPTLPDRTSQTHRLLPAYICQSGSTTRTYEEEW